MTRLKINRVVRTEEKTYSETKALRMLLCEGQADGVEGEFVVRLWSRDGGATFDGEREAVAGCEVWGAEPKDERYRTAMGATAYDWKPSRRNGGGAAGVGALAAVLRDFLAEWVTDRKVSRDLARERFEFEKRAKIAELTVSAMNGSNKEKVSFRETYRFLVGVMNWGTDDGSLG